MAEMFDGNAIAKREAKALVLNDNWRKAWNKRHAKVASENDEMVGS